MGKTKYIDLIKEYPEWNSAVKVLEEIQSPCLQPCAKAFLANMSRTAVFSMMPADILWELMWVNARWRTGGGEIDPKEMFSKPRSEEERREFLKQADAFWKWTESDIEKARKAGVNGIDTLADERPHLAMSINAMLVSAILESWLFFEALVSDLWVSAVDNGGKLISGRVGSVPRKKPDDSMPKVEEMDANFRTHPGSFWREAGIVTFQKRRDIVEHYSVAFGSEIKTIFDNTAGGDVWALNAYRNCITHSAGRVDHTFRKQAAPFPEFRNLPLKSRLLIDGALTARLRNAAIITGAALLQEVDKMLLRGD